MEKTSNKAQMLFDCIKTCLQKKIPFAAYRLPKKDKINLIFSIKQPSNTQINYNKKGFISHPFSNTEKTIFIPADYSVTNQDVTKNIFNKLKNTSFQKSDNQRISENSTSKKEYLFCFHNFMEKIKSGQIEKAVLSKCLVIDFYEEKVITLFKALCKKYEQAFVSLIFHPDCGIWLGASPEIFLKIKGKQCETVSLAGTIQKEMSWTQKEKHEQEVVTNYISKVIQQFKVSDVKVDDIKESMAGHLRHLSTSFRFKLIHHDKDLMALINNLHPTPAVCGIPKNESYKLIIQTEKHDRKYYSGFIGPINIFESTRLFVNIRCMNIIENQAVLYSGGGITEGSDAQKEWGECLAKEQTLLQLIKNLE